MPATEARPKKKPSISTFDEPSHWPATFGATASVTLKGNRAGSVDRLIQERQDLAQRGPPMDSQAYDHAKAERLSINKFSTLQECHLKLFRTYFRTEWTEDLLMSIFFETIPVLHRPDDPADAANRHMICAPFGVIADNVEDDFIETAKQRAFYMQAARRSKQLLNGQPFDEPLGSGKQFFKDVSMLYHGALEELNKARKAPWWELRPEHCGQLRTSGIRKLVHLHLSTLRELSARTEGDDAFVQVATAADEHEIALQVAYMLEYRAHARAAKLQSHRKRITASLHALARKMRAEEDGCKLTWRNMFDALKRTVVPTMIEQTQGVLEMAVGPARDQLSKTLQLLQSGDPNVVDGVVKDAIEKRLSEAIDALRSFAEAGTAGAAAAAAEVPNVILAHCEAHVKHSERFEKTYSAYTDLLQLGASIDDALSKHDHLSLLGTEVKLYPLGAQTGSPAAVLPETLSEAMIRQRDASNKCLFAKTDGTRLTQGLAAQRAIERELAEMSVTAAQVKRAEDRMEGLKHVFEQRLTQGVHLESNSALFGKTQEVTDVDLRRCKIKEDEPHQHELERMHSALSTDAATAAGPLWSERAVRCYKSHFGRDSARSDPAKSTHDSPEMYTGWRKTPKISVPAFMDPPMLPMRVSAPPREGKTALSLLLASFAIKLGFTVLLGVAPNKKIPVSEMFEKLNKLHWDEPVDVLSDEYEGNSMTPTFGDDEAGAKARSAGLVTAFIQGTPEKPVLCVRHAGNEPRRIELSRDNHVGMAKALHSGNRANRVRLIVFSTEVLGDIEGVARILRFIEEEDPTGLAFKMYDEAQFLCKDEPVVPLRKFKKVEDVGFNDRAWSETSPSAQLDALRSTYPLIYGLNCCITATHLATFFERPLYGSLLAESSPPIDQPAGSDATLTESEQHNIEQKLLHRQAPLVVDARSHNRLYYPVLPPALQPRKIRVFDPLLEYSDGGEYGGALEKVTYVGSSAIIGPIWSCVEYVDRLKCSPMLRLDEGLIGRAAPPAKQGSKTTRRDDSDDEDDESEDDDETEGEEKGTDALEAIGDFLDVKDPSWNLRLTTVQFIDYLLGRLHRTEAVPPVKDDLHLSDRYGNWFDEVYAHGSDRAAPGVTVIVPTHVMAVSKNVQADMGMLHQIRWMQIHGLFANFCRSGRLLLQPKMSETGLSAVNTPYRRFWKHVRPPTDELFHLHDASIDNPQVDATPTWAMRAARRIMEPSLELDNFVAENGFGFVVFASNAAVDASKIEKAGAHGGFVELNKGLVDQVSINLDSLCHFKSPDAQHEVDEQLDQGFEAVRSALASSGPAWPSRATRDFALAMGVDYPRRSVLAKTEASKTVEDWLPRFIVLRRLELLWWKARWDRIAEVIVEHTVKDAETKCVLFLSDPLLDANSVHDPYHHWNTQKDFNNNMRARHAPSKPGDGLKNGPEGGSAYLNDVSKKLKEKGKEIMNSILGLEAKARELIERFVSADSAAMHGPEYFCATLPVEERESEFFDHLMNSMLKKSLLPTGQMNRMTLEQLPDATDSAVVFVKELKGSNPIAYGQIEADLQNGSQSEVEKKLLQTFEDGVVRSKKFFGAPLKKAVEYAELLHLVNEEHDETEPSRDDDEPGPSASATKLDAESRFKSKLYAARSYQAAGVEWYSDISHAFPNLGEVMAKTTTASDSDTSYARGRTWAFRCASADDALAIARAVGVFKMTMVGYDAMSAGLTIQSQVRSDNGAFHNFVAYKACQRAFVGENSDPGLAATPIHANELLDLARSRDSYSALLVNKGVITHCVQNCIDLVTACAPFLDVVNEYKDPSNKPFGSSTPEMNFEWDSITTSLQTMIENYTEGDKKEDLKTYLDSGLLHLREKTRICYVPGSIALASSKNVALDDAYQMLGRTFVDMKNIPLPIGWQVSMLGAMCRPTIGRKPTKMWTESTFDLFTKPRGQSPYESPESKFARIKEYADRFKAYIAFLQVLRQLATVEHALADEPSPSGEALKHLTGLHKFKSHLPTPLPGTGSVLVPQGVETVDESRHGSESSHMSTLLRMQSRGLYTGLAAAMLGNSRQPLPALKDVPVPVSFAANRAARPMADALSTAFVNATSVFTGNFEPADFDSLSTECKTMLTRRVGHRDHGTGANAVTASWRVFYQTLKRD